MKRDASEHGARGTMKGVALECVTKGAMKGDASEHGTRGPKIRNCFGSE
jgi:hypothetical protein